VKTDDRGKTVRERYFKKSRRVAAPKKAAKATTSKAKADTAEAADKDAE
jgi:large subunit ribosomal protein L24